MFVPLNVQVLNCDLGLFVQMAILRRKMEGLSNGMLLERMNDEYGSMLLSMADSSAASSVPTPKRTEVPNVSSSPKEHPCKVNVLCCFC